MLWLLICVGSSPLSVIVQASSKVGLPAVLPCSVASHMASDHTPHIQWQTISDSVLERMGEELFQGEAYRTGWMSQSNNFVKKQIFIQSVQLAVIDHKAIRSVETGADLILDLYTDQAEQVIFQNCNESDWTVLWERGVKKGYLKERGNKLTLRKVSARSAGTYKVLDSEGLALSTVKVTVTEPVLPKETETLQIQSASGKLYTSRVIVT
ncbi:Methylthioribose-1-phosphate isomerase [Labeo rohita]|uniref:Methylthioribose-1-phosphate isomerase n=1 Tax=Labeo rohita TaxID=84645 RepID=A0ABQ8LZW2_LABRO|nr:Methylthioribose-1-phosphate isomerase [Labeo rohita]